MAETAIMNVLLCGIGGQGVLTASEILAEAAIAAGHDVKKTEVAGMAQRGGVVTSHLRFGPKVYSPAIPPGQADVLLAFELAEGLRWITHLKPSGIALVNTMRIIPPVVSTGLFRYPEDPLADIRDSGTRMIPIDAGGIAKEMGNLRLVNSVMLGAVADSLPLEALAIKAALIKRFSAKKPELGALNAQAFEAGRAAALAGAKAA
ncbi:MAG: indolepyruvate oxidoreductase subunit beta [Alphaproteobacteria bacterium]|jgi:indolepyruvate ferredoxin oxidoreductase beta subunit|nr:indolepyruvate oxidoreductase subunit beta [Alphaproteobacteria bacterium]